MNGEAIFWWTTIMVALGGLFLFIWNVLRYKHIVIIRELANDRKYIIRDRARDYTDKSKLSFWKLKKEKDKIKKLMPLPPQEAIDLTKRGKKFIEVYRTELGEYIYITDVAKIIDVDKDFLDSLDEMPEHIKQILDNEIRIMEYHKWKNEQIKQWRKQNNVLQPFKPLTTDQRMTLVNQIKIAESRTTSDWKKDLPTIVLSASLIVLIAIAAIFAPDIINTYTKGATQISNSLQAYEEIRHNNMVEEMKQWEKVTAGIQTISNMEQENSKRIDQLEKS